MSAAFSSAQRFLLLVSISDEERKINGGELLRWGAPQIWTRVVPGVPLAVPCWQHEVSPGPTLTAARSGAKIFDLPCGTCGSLRRFPRARFPQPTTSASSDEMPLFEFAESMRCDYTVAVWPSRMVFSPKGLKTKKRDFQCLG